MDGCRPSPDMEALLEHRGFVQALARRLVADSQLAEDVAQDTMLAALRNPPPRPGILRRWLARIVRNRSYTLLRDQRRRRVKEAGPASLRERSRDAGQEVERLAWHSRVVETLLALDEPYRGALVLRYYEDLSPAEMARRLGVPAATVRTRLKRGIEMMRARLDREHRGDRRAWCLALLALAEPVRTGPGAVAVGVTIMKVKSKAVLVTILLLAAITAIWSGALVLHDGSQSVRRTEAEARGFATRESGDAEEAPDARSKTLIVRVCDLADRPIVGALVEIVRRPVNDFSGPPFVDVSRGDIHGMTDVEGEVRLHAGWEWELAIVRASADGYGSTGAQFAPRIMDARPLTLRLGGACELTGSVRDGAGVPLEGASVIVSDPMGVPEGSVALFGAMARTDARGVFRLASLPRRDCAVWVALSGGLPFFVDLVRLPTVRSLDLVVHPGGAVTGAVRDRVTGVPIAGATVWVRGEERGLPVAGRAMTDASGVYRIGAIPECSLVEMAREKGTVAAT